MAPQTPSLLFRARLLWARMAGALEGVWATLWPAVPLLFLFSAIGLVSGWQAAPLWLHVPCLAALIVLVAWTGWHAFKSLRWPSQSDGLVALERTSKLKHQPLRKRSAGPAHGDAFAQSLWQTHLERMNAARAKVRAPKPVLSWIEKDRYGLTTAALILFCTGLLFAGARAPGLLASSFVPDLGGAPASAVVTVLATPPAYVKSPPILLSAFDVADPSAQDMPLPEGTRLEITLVGGWRTPVLDMGGRSIAMEETEDRSYRLDVTATPSDTLKVRQGGRVQFDWASPIVADEPPAIAFADVPERTTNDALKISYEVFDDYGVESAALLVTPQEAPQEVVRDDIPPPNVAPNTLETRGLYKDLTPSKWAGRPVILTLLARDGLDQRGQSGPIELILPERAFTHPVARALIQQRKRLFFEAGSRLGVANAIDDISRAPEELDHSLWAFSMLRSAYYRLTRNDRPAVAREVTNQLWAIATFLEDGGISAQREAMRQSLEDMMSALENADTQEFDKLAQDLQSKISELMAKQMQQMQSEGPTPQIDGGEMRMIDSSTLERMMQQMRDMAAAGDMAGAMQMLQAIQSLMENLNTAPGPSAESMAQAQAAQDALEDLEELIAEQRALMNQTVREALENSGQNSGQQGSQQGEQSPGQAPQGQSQDQTPGQSPGQSPGEQAGGQAGRGQYGSLSQSQSGLQRDGQAIGQALSDAGLQAPESLGAAGENMGSAAARLGEERGLPALREQADALRHLTDAQGALEQQVNQLMDQIRQQSAGRDPFGRPNGNSQPDDGQVKIPTEAEAKRARDIRDEIQRRLGDPGRAPLERSYLRRLLERFSR